MRTIRHYVDRRAAEQPHDTVLHQLLHAAGAGLYGLVNTLHSSVAELNWV